MRIQLTNVRANSIRPLLAAILVIAITFTLSCSSDDGSGNPSSNSWGGASSSGSSSSSSIAVVYGTPVTYEGETYETVVIGEQTWMARNLNYAVEDSKCGNCNRVGYGRLYDWATAMALPPSCRTESCDDMIVYPHRGICPEGWHIPSDTEWTTLTDFTGEAFFAIKKLEATGFSTLMNGLHSGGVLESDYYRQTYYSDGEYILSGYAGYWWSASERFPDYAYIRTIVSSQYGIGRHYNSKGNSLSVRCLQDSGPPVDLCAGFAEGAEREHYGRSKPQFCDSRDGKKYVYVSIGEQTWMAENLNYAANESKCQGNLDSNCDIYGRLYGWATAMAISSVYNRVYYNSTAKHKGVCPSGWHIPNDAEGATLEDYVGSEAGRKLKTTSGWAFQLNGMDTYGFSALPIEGNSSGYWWSADGDDSWGNYLFMAESHDLYQSHGSKENNSYSVRCLKD